jgi:hypothetical protein
MNANAWIMAGLGIALALTSDAPKRVAGHVPSPQHVLSPQREASLKREAEIAALLGIQPRYTEHVVEDIDELPEIACAPCFCLMNFDGTYASDFRRRPENSAWKDCPR